eukprot:jgi/Botrbrau1/23175/Bobra.0041s0026.1
MANYYHEARAHARSVKTLSEDNRRRAERRAEMATIHAEQPHNLLRVDGRACKMKHNQEQYDAIESMQGMLPWNGQQDNLIDRFDGRALLDFYQEPPQVKRVKTDREKHLDELVAFEAFRDLVKLRQMGLSEEAGLHAALLENVELRANAVSSAAAAAGVPLSHSLPKSQPQYGAVGLRYDGGEEGGSSSGSSDSDDEEGEGGSEEEAEDETSDEESRKLDQLAASMGLPNFSVMQRRAEREEADIAAGRRTLRKRPLSRKKAAERARRMAGQGLISFEKPKIPTAAAAAAAAAAARPGMASWDRLPLRGASRGSPTYDLHRRDRSSSRSRSASRSRSSRSPSRSRSPYGRRSDRPRARYITHFSSKHAEADTRPSHRSSAKSRKDGSPPSRRASDVQLVEALPGTMDPAVDGGPVSLPASATIMHGVRAGDYWDREEERRRERRERELERVRERERQLEHSRAAAAKPVDKQKETPMERLKRLRAAQLNKQFQKDSLNVVQKRLAEEKDRQARLQIERAALAGRRSPSPPRSPGPSSSHASACCSWETGSFGVPTAA